MNFMEQDNSSTSNVIHKRPLHRRQQNDDDFLKRSDSVQEGEKDENKKPSSSSATPSRSKRIPISSSPIESISFQTPVRGNTSAKIAANLMSAHVILKDICTSDKFNTHILQGPPGIGKTFLAHQIAQLPLTKMNFPDGAIWIGTEKRGSLNYTDLIDMYNQIYKHLFSKNRQGISVKERFPDFSSIFYGDSPSNIESLEDKEDKMDAMLQARTIMSMVMDDKSCLLCVDGLQDWTDFQYFDFSSKQNSYKSKLIATYCDPIGHQPRMKVWSISGLNVVDAKELFENLTSRSTSHPNFLPIYRDTHLSCRGNPCVLQALSCLINDKLESKESQVHLQKFSSKFASAPLDPQVQIAIITESLFSHSSLGKPISKLAFRCFASFASVFTRENCTRPFVPRAPIRILFKGILAQIERISYQKDDWALIDRILEFVVRNNLLIQVDGFDHKNSPRLYYQVSCNMLQNYATSLSSDHEKLHAIFTNQYHISCTDGSISIGSHVMDSYMLDYLPFHCIKAKLYDDAAKTLKDMRFFKDRIEKYDLEQACIQHIKDSEELGSEIGMKKMNESQKVIGAIYSNCFRFLVDTVEIDSPHSSELIIKCVWRFAFSFLKSFMINDACILILQAMKLQDGLGRKVIDLEYDFVSKLSTMKSSSPLQSSRALILFGAALCLHEQRRSESYQLLVLGLSGLEISLGEGSLEVVRAQVYIGEILYKEFRDYKKALSMFQNALHGFNTLFRDENEEVIDLLVLIGKACVHAGELDAALEIFKRVGPKLSGTLALDIDVKVGYIYIVKQKFERALKILSKARTRTDDQVVIDRIDELIEQCGDNDRCSV